MQKFDKALSDFRKVIELDPCNEKADFLIGSIYGYNGDKRFALDNYRQATRVTPDFMNATKAVKELEPTVAEEAKNKKQPSPKQVNVKSSGKVN